MTRVKQAFNCEIEGFKQAFIHRNHDAPLNFHNGAKPPSRCRNINRFPFHHMVHKCPFQTKLSSPWQDWCHSGVGYQPAPKSKTIGVQWFEIVVEEEIIRLPRMARNCRMSQRRQQQVRVPVSVPSLQLPRTGRGRGELDGMEILVQMEPSPAKPGHFFTRVIPTATQQMLRAVPQASHQCELSSLGALVPPLLDTLVSLVESG
jgi:hypothetical protein